MIVFGVCAVGVSCLYLVPNIAGTPTQLGLEPLADEPSRTPAAASGGGTSRPTTTGTTQDASSPAGPDSPTDEALDSTDDGQPSQRRPARGATAYDPDDSHDNQPPTAVQSIRSATATPRKLSLTWAPASDNVGVVGYRVWVNGFAVATTAETHATVRWFNDDSGQHVVQVRAIDAQGNESETSPTLVVTRPSTEPTPTPTPDPTPATSQPTEPAPTTSPEPTTQPTTSATTQSEHDTEADDTEPAATPTAPGESASPTA